MVFGDLGSLTDPEQLLQESIDLVAIASHEAYRQAAGAAAIPAWSELSEQAKQSNRAFADHIAVKLAELDSGQPLGREELERWAEMEHWRWSSCIRCSRTGRISMSAAGK